jgi:hypothetical protein
LHFVYRRDRDMVGHLCRALPMTLLA